MKMSETIDFKRFDAFKEVEEEFVKKIKLFYIFRDINYENYSHEESKNIMIVTNDDKVYCYGLNTSRILGFGHSMPIKILTLNEDLSNKGIIDLKSGYHFVIARTIDGKIYCWGKNGNGELGFGKRDFKIYKPELNHNLSDKHIIDISCGASHSLALTSNGEIYVWGCNEFGQIGCSLHKKAQSMPIILDVFGGEKVQSISCGSKHSMILTESGTVFGWGYNAYNQLGLEVITETSSPKPINLNAIIIEKISSGHNHSILLTSDGDIYATGGIASRILRTDSDCQSKAVKINNFDKFKDIASHSDYDFSVALSVNSVVYIIENNEEFKFEETGFQSFNKFFANHLMDTNKAINCQQLEESTV